MVYFQKLVACIKVGGQVLRDTDNTVSIPFGSEYSILLKNLNSKRIQVKILVDGQDATEGTWLIIGPNQSLELERYIRNGNLQSGNRFKFIPRTKQIEKHRGLKADDGLVRIEYRTEKVATTQDVHITRTHYHDYYDYYWPWNRPYYPRPWGYPWDPIWCGSFGFGQSTSGFVGSSDNVSYSATSGNIGAMQNGNTNMMAFNSADASSQSGGDNVDDSGITVPGSESNQQFCHASDFACHEQTEVIVIKLRGAVGGEPVAKAVTVKTRSTCQTCGKKSKGDKKFCAQCGTALSLI
jgi:hypothetical protein